MISLSTPRLTLRPWEKADAEVLLGIRGDPNVATWLGSPEPWSHVIVATNEIVSWQRQLNAPDPFGTWAIVPNEPSNPRPVGSVSLNPIRFGTEVEVGWYLHPDAVGNGWAGEAATEVIEHGLRSDVRRIWALMWRDNDASAKVARRIGMRELGVLIDPWYGTDKDPYSRMFISHRAQHRLRRSTP